MHKILTVLIGIVAIVFGTRVPVTSKRIVGGDEAPFEHGLFHASIQNLTGSHVCGGAIVSEWLVVTAAHCVSGANPDYMTILSGTNRLNVGGKKYNVADIIIYEHYNSTSRENDIALLKTAEPFDLRYLRTLKLRRQEVNEGDALTLSGFGTQEPNGESSTTMKTLQLAVFNQETCRYALRYATRPVTDAMFCTFTRMGEGTCHGDSGSPVMKDKELVGIVSWGIPCGIGYPDVHTRISPFVDWIQKQILKAHCEPRNILEKLKRMAQHTRDVPPALVELLSRENLM